MILGVPGQFLLLTLSLLIVTLPFQMASDWTWAMPWWGIPVVMALNLASAFVTGHILHRANPRRAMTAVRWCGGLITLCWAVLAVAMLIRDLTSPRVSAPPFDRITDWGPISFLMILTTIAGLYAARRANPAAPVITGREAGMNPHSHSDRIAEIMALSGTGLLFAFGFLLSYGLLSAVIGMVLPWSTDMVAPASAALVAGYAMLNVGLTVSKHYPPRHAVGYMLAALVLLHAAALWKLFVQAGRDLAEAWPTQPLILGAALSGMALAWHRWRPYPAALGPTDKP
ncbi:MAG: hypothetical protein ACT6Q8_16100 [Niveispirillum sp.]|uniref:hypothetical protein n=1 Tax=Niveispirillum sp. TaxID=1917217 RepID=UPI0040364254